MSKKQNNTSVTIYNTDDGAQFNVSFDNKGEAWLSVKDIAELYGCEISIIKKHLKLVKIETGKGGAFLSLPYPQSPLKTKSGKMSTNKQMIEVEHYNLDTVLRIGYRVKSKEASIFRDWATKHLIAVATKGYSISDNIDEDQVSELAIDSSVRLRNINEYARLIHNSLFCYNATRYVMNTQMKIIRMLLCNAITKMNPIRLVELRNDPDEPNCGMRLDVELTETNVRSSVSYLTEEELKAYEALAEAVSDSILTNFDKMNIKSVGNNAKKAIKEEGYVITSNPAKYRNPNYINTIKEKVVASMLYYIKQRK